MPIQPPAQARNLGPRRLRSPAGLFFRRLLINEKALNFSANLFSMFWAGLVFCFYSIPLPRYSKAALYMRCAHHTLGCNAADQGSISKLRHTAL